MKTNDDNSIFEEYKDKLIFKSICEKSTDYFLVSLSSKEALDLFTTTIANCPTYKESINSVKIILNKNGLNKYRLQFKQFKYRQKNSLVNITIKRETYNKLLAIKDDFGGINDMLFEYALDNHHHIDTSKINDLPSSLTNNEKLTVTLALLDTEVKDQILIGLQDAFEAGIREGQKMKKCRSKKALDTALLEMKYKY